MPQTIQVGNDTVTFPDGMSDADMHTALQKEYGGVKNTIPNAAPAAPLKADQGLGVAYGFKHPADNVATWIDKAIPGAKQVEQWTHDNLGMATSEEAIAGTKQAVADAAAKGRKPGFMGKVVGNTVASIPIMAATRNPWLTGAMMGATDTNTPNDAAGTAVDAGIAAIGGGVGHAVLSGVGAAISPRLNPMVRRLLAEGVQLTPGQVLGGMAHRLEDATRSIYGLGDMVIGAQANAQRSLNRVAVQRTVEPLGIQIPRDMPEGHAQVGFAQRTLGDAYHRVLADIDHLAAPTGSTLPVPPGGHPPLGLNLDHQFGSDVGTLRRMAQGLPQDQQHVFESFIQGEMRHAFGQNGSISGDAMKKLDELIGQRARNFRSSASPHDRDMGMAFSELQAHLRDMVGRQFPQHQATINAVNQGWAALTRLEPIAANAQDGVFTAPALRAGAVAADKTMRHRASARGDALMQDLGNDASGVMRNTIPDSGTPARALASAGAGYALFGNPIHGVHVNPWAAATLGALAVPYMNRTTGAATRAALSQRPAGAAAIRAAIDRILPAGTAIGANAALDQRPN